MASNAPLRSLRYLAQRPSICSSCALSVAGRPVAAHSQGRLFSATAAAKEEVNERPRWSYTPEKMKAPFHPRIKDPTKAWTCNEDPKLVDAVYAGLLGRGGEKALSEEVKWLAITHKSFDQGRRGFNDRLAFFGKRILVLQSTIALLNSQAPPPPSTDVDRLPFRNAALDGLPKLQAIDLSEVLSKKRMGQLAQSYGLDKVTRWKPRYPERLQTSGVDVVMTTSLYAIIGALALQKGGEVANQVAREKILKPLGIL